MRPRNLDLEVWGSPYPPAMVGPWKKRSKSKRTQLPLHPMRRRRRSLARKFGWFPLKPFAGRRTSATSTRHCNVPENVENEGEGRLESSAGKRETKPPAKSQGDPSERRFEKMDKTGKTSNSGSGEIVTPAEPRSEKKRGKEELGVCSGHKASGSGEKRRPRNSNCYCKACSGNKHSQLPPRLPPRLRHYGFRPLVLHNQVRISRPTYIVPPRGSISPRSSNRWPSGSPGPSSPSTPGRPPTSSHHQPSTYAQSHGPASPEPPSSAGQPPTSYLGPTSSPGQPLTSSYIGPSTEPSPPPSTSDHPLMSSQHGPIITAASMGFKGSAQIEEALDDTVSSEISDGSELWSSVEGEGIKPISGISATSTVELLEEKSYRHTRTANNKSSHDRSVSQPKINPALLRLIMKASEKSLPTKLPIKNQSDGLNSLYIPPAVLWEIARVANGPPHGDLQIRKRAGRWVTNWLKELSSMEMSQDKSFFVNSTIGAIKFSCHFYKVPVPPVRDICFFLGSFIKKWIILEEDEKSALAYQPKSKLVKLEEKPKKLELNESAVKSAMHVSPSSDVSKMGYIEITFNHGSGSVKIPVEGTTILPQVKPTSPERDDS